MRIFRKPTESYIVNCNTVEDLDNVYYLFLMILETQGGFKLKVDLEESE